MFKLSSWYLGITEHDSGYYELLESFHKNEHNFLINDIDLLNKFKSYMDPNKIPSEFKQGKSYYRDYENVKDSVFPVKDLDDKHVLIRDSNINSLVKKLFNRDISPLLADQKYLVGLPKAYFIIFEWDELKDEAILYAERLKEANVEVKVAFYEKGFHGMAAMIRGKLGETAREIQNELIEYIKTII